MFLHLGQFYVPVLHAEITLPKQSALTVSPESTTVGSPVIVGSVTVPPAFAPSPDVCAALSWVPTLLGWYLQHLDFERSHC